MFRKDGTTVGSISTTGGDIEINSATGNSKNVDIIGRDSGGNARGIAVGSGSVRPNADNSIDLGTTSERFKDLYLSGGVNNPTAGGTLTFSTTGSERMRIDSSGNVGIGTTSPAHELEIAAVAPILRLTDTDTTAGSGQELGKIEFYTNDADGAHVGADIACYSDDSLGRVNGLTFSVSKTNFADATEAMRINSSGNVGIGTSSPTNGKLEVTHSSSTVPAGFFRNTSGSGDSPSLTVQGGANNAAPNFSVLDYNGNTDFIVQGAGNVGIGTTSINSSLQVSKTQTVLSGTSNTYGVHIYPTSSGATYVDGITSDGGGAGITLRNYYNGTYNNVISGATDTATTTFQTGGTERMRITSGGNVGIGTTVPAAELEVNGDALTSWAAASTKFIGSKFSTTYDLGMYMDTDNRKLTLSAKAADSTGTITFQTGVTPSERMRIDSSGNLLVGTTSLSSSVDANTVQSSISGNAQVYVTHVTGTGSGIYYLAFSYGGSVIGSITQSGTTAVAYNTSSDYRLKEDVQPMVGASDRLMALKPVNFAWKADGSRTDGFLAHEAQEVVPQAVTGEKDGEQMQAIDHSKLVPLLTAALQEALTKIEALEVRLNALEGQ